MGIFQRLNVEQEITVILVTHEPDIAEHTRRVIRLYDGLIAGDEYIAMPRVAGDSAYGDRIGRPREC
jgi:putative ABC transport system ATP-binding protein